MPFRFKRMDIPDVVCVQADVFSDERGYFFETFKISDFRAEGIPGPFVQANHSRSARHVLRGLHYQKDPAAQGKLVTVVSGEVFDVALDMRAGSPSYGKWVGVSLSARQKNALYIPPGFAHGFCALSEGAEVIYYCTHTYEPRLERGVLWNDPDLAITWPTKTPQISDKDRNLPPLNQADNNFVFGPAEDKRE